MIGKKNQNDVSVRYFALDWSFFDFAFSNSMYKTRINANLVYTFASEEENAFTYIMYVSLSRRNSVGLL